MGGEPRTNRKARARLAGALAGLCVAWAAAAPSGAETPKLAQPDAGRTRAIDAEDPCWILKVDATPLPHALANCRLHREKQWGLDDERLLDLYAALGDKLTGSQRLAASALPYRRRAHQLAARLFGDADPRSADAALTYARTWILSGRCEIFDPRVLPLIQAARTGYAAMPPSDPKRLPALRRAAEAFSDALRYTDAAETLGLAESALSAGDWERIARWRLRAGERDGAEAAYLKVLGTAETEKDADRIAAARVVRAKQALKKIYFADGALDKARALEDR